MLRAVPLKFNEPNPNPIWRHSLIACLAGLAIFSVTITIDLAEFYGRISVPRWLSVGGADDARVIMSALLSSVSTVLALLFTVIMLVLSIAATWFGPRLMSRFLRQSRIASWILGLFLSSFIECVLTLLAIRERHDLVWLRQVTILMTITLVVLSFFALVYLCHRVAQAIQAGNVLTILINDLRLAIRSIPSTSVIDPARRRVATSANRSPISRDIVETQSDLCELDGGPVYATRTGYLREIDHVPLFMAAHRADAVIRLMFRPGQFVTTGAVLAYVMPPDCVTDLAQAVDPHHVLGRQRSLKEDLEFGMAQIVEIALRALSAAINDVYTALYCVDWLGEALVQLALLHPFDGTWTTPSGTIRLLEPPLLYSRLVKVAFNQIRQAAPGNPALTIRLFETFARMASQSPDEDHGEAVRLQVEALWEMAASVTLSRMDRSDIKAAYEMACRAGAPPGGLPPAVKDATIVPIPGVPAAS